MRRSESHELFNAPAPNSGAGAGVGASDDPPRVTTAGLPALFFRKPAPENPYARKWIKLFNDDWKSRLSVGSGSLLTEDLGALRKEGISVVDNQVVMEGLLALKDYLLATLCPWSSCNFLQRWHWGFALDQVEESLGKSLAVRGIDVELHRVKVFHGEVREKIALCLGTDFELCKVLNDLVHKVFLAMSDIAQGVNKAIFFSDHVTIELLFYYSFRSKSFEESVPNASWHDFLMRGFKKGSGFRRAITLLPADDIFRLYLDKRVCDWLFDSKGKKFNYKNAVFFVEKVGGCLSVLASKLIGFKAIQTGILFLLYQKKFVQHYFWRWLMAEAVELNVESSLDPLWLLSNLEEMAGSQVHGLAFVDLLFNRMGEIYHQLDPHTRNYFNLVAEQMSVNCIANAEHPAREPKAYEVAWILRWGHLVAGRAKLFDEIPFWLAMWRSSMGYGYHFFASLLFHPISYQMFPEDCCPREQNFRLLDSEAIRPVANGLQKTQLSMVEKITKIKAAINLLLILAKINYEERIILTIMLNFRDRLLITQEIRGLRSKIKPGSVVISKISPFPSRIGWPKIFIEWLTPNSKAGWEAISGNNFTGMLSKFAAISCLEEGSLYYFAIERLLIEVGEVAATSQIDTLPAASVSRS